MLKFISLLGTNGYVPCNYFFKNKETIKVKDCCYVQKAILDLLKEENIIPDEIIIFTTDEAYEKNWVNNAWKDAKSLSNNSINNARIQEYGKEILEKEQQNRPGLMEELNNFKNITGADFKNVNIPNGTKEDELWEIFKIILNEINEQDEIIFDITHSFRYLPMLVFVVINYARVVKKCKLNSIYYGAFEVLGNTSQVKNIPLDDRNVPVFNLISFVDLFDWTIGIDRYMNTGDVSVINELTNMQIKRINEEKNKSVLALAKSTGQKIDLKTLYMDSNQLRELSNSMKEFSDVVFTCRGLKLTEVISGLKSKLNEVIDSASKQHIIPLIPVLEMMKNRFDRFSMDNDYINIIETARWCADNRMYQQGLTILEEGLISYACEKLGYRDAANKNNEKKRKDVMSYAFVVNSELGKRRDDKGNPVLNIKSNALTDLFILIQDMADTRNDINHAGWREHPYGTDVFEIKLKEYISRAEKILFLEDLTLQFNEYNSMDYKYIDGDKCNDNGYIISTRAREKKMLLIFSHELTTKQKEEAIQRFGVSTFISMPEELRKKWSNVPPALDDLHEYLRDILKWIDLNSGQGDYALIQGDYGATFIIVNYCLPKGIIPVHATTRRIVKEEKEGDKVVTVKEFEHVIFREYKF